MGVQNLTIRYAAGHSSISANVISLRSISYLFWLDIYSLDPLETREDSGKPMAAFGMRMSIRV
jgi:hypothetical protein